MEDAQVALADYLPARGRSTPAKLLQDFAAAGRLAADLVTLAEAHDGRPAVAAQGYFGRGRSHVNRAGAGEDARRVSGTAGSAPRTDFSSERGAARVLSGSLGIVLSVGLISVWRPLKSISHAPLERKRYTFPAA